MMFHLYGYVSDVYSIVYFLCLDTELLFRDATGGLSILTLTNYAQTQILSNTTFVSCNQCITNAIIDFLLSLQRRYNVAKFSLSPSRRFVLLTHGVKKVNYNLDFWRENSNRFLNQARSLNSQCCLKANGSFVYW